MGTTKEREDIKSTFISQYQQKGLTQREMPDMVVLLKVLMVLGEAEGS